MSTPPAQLVFDPLKPPLGLLAAVEALKFHNPQNNNTTDNAAAVTLSPSAGIAIPQLVFPSNSSLPQFQSSQVIIRYIGRLAPSLLYGTNPCESTEVDFFIELSRLLTSKDTLIQHVEQLDKHLLYRTYLVGFSASIADYIVYESLTSNMRWASFTKQASSAKQYPSLFRWLNLVTSLPEFVQPLKVKADTERALKEKRIAHSAGGHFDVDLPGATEGNVVTRFPPEPSGYLHIGHLKALLLNYHIAQSFGGKMLLRFDDTNPQKEKEEYVDSIVRDIQTVGVKWASRTNTSDYFPLIMEYAVKMLKEGKAYIDDTPLEEMRRMRGEGIESPGRNRSVEENLALFEEMKQATERGLQCCMRAKIDMQHKNKAMRDPVMYRCNLTPHHMTGTKWKVYPTYDAANPIVDSVEGVTHSLRTNEYRDRNEQYSWFCRAYGIREPIIRDYSRLNFVYTTLSKRKLTWFVDTKRVTGWDDPRMPTIQGILRRGMTVEALKEFILGQGFSQMTNLMEWDKIWTINKKVLDPKVPRLSAISTENSVMLHLTGEGVPTGAEAVTVDMHPKNKSVGQKVITRSATILLEQDDARLIKENEEVTLMNWGNAIINTIHKDSNGVVTKLEGTLNLKGDVQKTDKKLTWLDVSPQASADNVHVTLVEYDSLITVAKVEEDMNFEDIVRPQSKFDTPAIGEQSMRALNKGDYLQIPRRGYFIVDEIYRSAEKPLVLILIPDGKMKAVSTLSSKVDKAQIFQK